MKRQKFRVNERKREAQERQEARNKISNKDQLAKLDKFGHRAKKERARLKNRTNK